MKLADAVARFGAAAKSKLANPSIDGEPEDQLRGPLDTLFGDLTELCGIPRSAFIAVGETSLSSLKTRPDFAVTIKNVLVGFIEVKAPGKGADPTKFKDKHDRLQWDKLKSLPNLLYTDGNAFSVWQDGERVGSVVELDGDVETSGKTLAAPEELIGLFDRFIGWNPIAPKSAADLAETSARLCRLLRDEVTEQLSLGSHSLTNLATDWRKLLFPDADDKTFADGYAQAVTFGLLMARARGITLADGLDRAGKLLSKTNSLIGTALKLLTEDAENEQALKTSIGTLTRVLDAVDWEEVSKGRPDAWLYFYEDFLAVYDNSLRKMTGSYYTPPEVVESMVRLVDDVLKEKFGQKLGLASPAVTVADPAVGTGTFPLGIYRQVAATIAEDEGEGSVPEKIEAAISRLIAFEMQLGPFAVAQLRIHAELAQLIGAAPKTPLRMYVTDTLDNPYIEQEYLPQTVGPIADSRRQANEIKKNQKITVVIGNPPYKEKAKGKGGWVEPDNPHSGKPAILEDWFPPRNWGVGAHAKHLRNLYIYFWRWATWKVFDQKPNDRTGVVCFITVAGFLNGPGFQKMRDYLRRTADGVWVIDCTPEGHQPDVPTRIFQGVQQPVCIVLASRSKAKKSDSPAKVKYAVLPEGPREAKFAALQKLKLSSRSWQECSSDWRAPFLPAATGDWSAFPALDELFAFNGGGAMPGRTWIIAPDVNSLTMRWERLISSKPDQKQDLFVPHLNHGILGDRHIDRVIQIGLPGFPDNPVPISKEKGSSLPPVRFGFRSFDRQWIIPDNRVINRPGPELWRGRSDSQLYLTAPSDRTPTAGPAATFSAFVPDLHHYNGRGGRVFPVWRDQETTEPNLPPKLLGFVSNRFKTNVSAEDIPCYIAAVAANPAYTSRFESDLKQPGLRIPLTADAKLFAEAVEIGRRVVWLHTFGERCVDPKANRPAGPPRRAKELAPTIPRDGAIPTSAGDMPDEINYDLNKKRLLVGKGYIDHVPPEVWNYEVSGKRVLTQWFSYRKKNRERPIMGDRRPPSKLCDIQPDHWLPEYTTELLNVLHVLGELVALEPKQKDLLERICGGTLIPRSELIEAGAAKVPDGWRKSLKKETGRLFDDDESDD